jgi:hypothetical protein
VDDLAGSYLVCPSQVDPQDALGRNKSLEPVSKSTDEEGQLYPLWGSTIHPRPTGEGNSRSANGDGAIPELLVVVCKLVAARRALRAADQGRRKRVGHARVALEGHKATLDLGARTRDVGLHGSHVDRAALVCEARVFGEADGELARLGRSVDRGTGDKERKYGEDKGGGEVHGVNVGGERKWGRDDEASSAQVRAAYIRLEPMHSRLRNMRGDRVKPVRFHHRGEHQHGMQ